MKPSLTLIKYLFILACGATVALHAQSGAAQQNARIQELWNSGSYEKALAQAEKALALYPKDAELLGRYGYCHKILQRGDFGLGPLERAYALGPGNPLIKIWLVDANLAYGWKLYGSDPLETIARWTRALELEPAMPDYLQEIGKLYADWPEKAALAFPWLERAEEAGYADRAQLLYLRGVASMHCGRFAEADAFMRESLALEPESPYRLYVYASLQYKWGREEAWAEALELDLGFTQSDFVRSQEVNIRENLSAYYRRGPGLFAKARAHLQALLRGYPDRAEAAAWAADADALEGRQVTVTMHYAIDPEGDASFEIGLPAMYAYQRHLGYVFDPPPRSFKVYQRFGNSYAKLDYARRPAALKVEARIDLEQRSLAEGGFPRLDPDDPPARYLLKDSDAGILIDPDSPLLKGLASQIVGTETDKLRRAKLIHRWVVDNFSYEVVYPASIEEYFAARKGECGGFAFAFVALCRAAGIPARRVFSPILAYPDESTLGSHETSEFYVEGSGWLPVNNTGNVFGATSGVLSFWRHGLSTDPAQTLYPEFKRTTVSWTEKSGKKRLIRGG